MCAGKQYHTMQTKRIGLCCLNSKKVFALNILPGETARHSPSSVSTEKIKKKKTDLS